MDNITITQWVEASIVAIKEVLSCPLVIVLLVIVAIIKIREGSGFRGGYYKGKSHPDSKHDYYYPMGTNVPEPPRKDSSMMSGEEQLLRWGEQEKKREKWDRGKKKK
ncbi:MAG: hypothetical protein AMK69_19505 [Nitrospira bacterium SG8_3]|nr:MAG: hypothetical protein AMK69_19505 [Nitrospira bacterium SG8_3]